MFYTYETDPSWVDMSCFNFMQQTSDAVLKHAAKFCEEVLIPELEQAIKLIEDLGENISAHMVDLKDRLSAMKHMIISDKALIKVQYLTHMADKTEDKAEIKKLIQDEMKAEIENTEKFITLLDTSKSVLIPTTSGEETVYMYKTPMSNSLKRKVIVMKNHINDEPEGIKLDY